MNVFKDEEIMIDTVRKIGHRSIIQHGKLSDRIYLIKLDMIDLNNIVDMLTELAELHKYSKIVCKIPKRAFPIFIAAGYTIEGYVPGLFNRKEDALFVSRFLSADRMKFANVQDLQQLTELLYAPSGEKSTADNGSAYSIRKLEKSDVETMVKVYSEVFKSYPSPIFDTSYLKQMMDDNVRSFGAFKDGQLAALASSEIDFKAQNAEMTDFATHPLHTQRNLSCLLLEAMEHDMKQQGITTLYSIARVRSIPMNKTFLRFGYEYSGTMINNTQIAGSIESMNIYYKHI